MNLSIIGAGNIGVSIAKGLLDTKTINKITVSRRDINRISYLKDLGIKITDNNLDCIKDSDIIILAIKPQQCENVLTEIKPFLKNQIIISVVTGKEISDIENIIGSGCSIFRAIPNTAISEKKSMTCISCKKSELSNLKKVEELFANLGETLFVEEKLLDACTVMAACGIAFALRYIRAATQAGIQIGLDSETALKIVTQTVIGASTLIQNNKSHPEQEIDKVTTPQGCTIVGLNQMEHEGLSSSLIKGIQCSFEAIEKIKSQS
jgi:pyrroline-5-carboxylate reductase